MPQAWQEGCHFVTHRPNLPGHSRAVREGAEGRLLSGRAFFLYPDFSVFEVPYRYEVILVGRVVVQVSMEWEGVVAGNRE